MLRILHRRTNFLHHELNQNLIKRFFLSNEYKCSEVWQNRLKKPVFDKINFESLYYDLDRTFDENKRVCVLDVDFLANIVNSYNFKNELEDVLLRLRKSPESAILPERTTHAVIRWYMDNAPKEDILNILSDRLNYGVFPDYYLTNLLMDNYLNKKDPISAVKIAVLQMLQEDFDNPIMKSLALHSCFSYLASSDIWAKVKEPEPDPEEEVEKVRVPYLRNPYFDDHFDIDDPNHLVGKTLYMFGKSLGVSALGTSSQLVGLVLYEKYKECAAFLKNVIQSNSQIHADAVVKAKEFIAVKPKQPEEETKEESKTEKKEEGKTEKKEESIDPSKTDVLKLLEELGKKNLIQGDLLGESEKAVRKTIEEHEKTDIQSQCQVYKEWEKERDEHIQYEIKRNETLKLQNEIKQTKEDMRLEEEELFFFDEEEEHKMTVEKKEEEMKSVFYYKSRKKKDVLEDSYVPPEVTQKKQ